jgi:chromosome segregation ATPase
MKSSHFSLTDKSNPTAERSCAFEETDATVDSQGRRWPRLMTVPRNPVTELENTVAKLSAELTQRSIQVADIYNLQQQQAGDLLIACDEIDRLSKSIGTLQHTITHLENDAVTSAKKLAQLDQENINLQQQLDKSLNESGALLQRLLRAETTLNEKELAIVSAQERYAQMRAEFTAAQTGALRAATSVDEVNERHLNELNRQSSQFKGQIRKIEDMAAVQSGHVQNLEVSRAALSNRCDDLCKTLDAFESDKKNTREKFESQAVEVLEVLLKVERESAENRISELTAELDRERIANLNTERASAEIRRNMLVLLPKLAELRGLSNSAKRDPSISQNNAA